MMNYEQTIEYLFSRLPMFQREGKIAYKKDLTNTLALCEHLHNPQKKFKSIHIAGTNGKGSTAHLLASIFQEADYKTGLYTSPHLKDFRERVRINGEMISKQAVMEFVATNKDAFEQIKPSFFEWSVALAFYQFALEKVDIAIVETGMGGRLDSTNVLNPELSIITNIGLDHTQYLGNTKEEIAKEKAGIIKEKVPLVIGEKSGVGSVFQKVAESKNSAIYFAEELTPPSKLKTALLGAYQVKNLKTVYAAFMVLKRKWRLSEKHLLHGCLNVVQNTALRGRWDILSKKPMIIADTAHNEDGLKETMTQIKSVKNATLHLVLGVVSDKDLNKILPLFPKNASYYFCAANIARALPADELKEKAKGFNLSGESYLSVEEALKAAIKAADENDFIYVGGSTFTVAEIIGEKWDVLDSNQ